MSHLKPQTKKGEIFVNEIPQSVCVYYSAVLQTDCSLYKILQRDGTVDLNKMFRIRLIWKSLAVVRLAAINVRIDDDEKFGDGLINISKLRYKP